MIENSNNPHKVLASYCIRKMQKVRKAGHNKVLQTLHFYITSVIENFATFKVKFNLPAF